jgi:hypothetical protein
MNENTNQNDCPHSILKSDLEKTKQEILSELKKEKPLIRKLIPMIVPSLVTAIVGAGLAIFVSRVESNIERKVQEETERHHALLERSQNFYNRRFETYMQLYKAVTALKLSLNTHHPEDKELLNDIAYLSEMNDTHKLILSPEVYGHLYEIWHVIFNAAAIKNTIDYSTIKRTEDLRNLVEKQMKKELNIDKLATY